MHVSVDYVACKWLYAPFVMLIFKINKGAHPNFRPMSIVSKRLDGSRCHLVRRYRPKRHCVRWGPSYPSPERGQSPQFSVHVDCGQTAACISWYHLYGGRPRLRPHCDRWRPSSLLQKEGTAPNFRPMSIVAKRSPISAAAEDFSLRYCAAVYLNHRM